MAHIDMHIYNGVPVLKELDTLLRCGICYEYMETTMITNCSHNYCSLCIRKSLMYRTQCPSCFEEAFDHQLRKNKLIDEFIVLFARLSFEIRKFVENGNSNVCQNTGAINSFLSSENNINVSKFRESELKHDTEPSKTDKRHGDRSSESKYKPTTSFFSPKTTETEAVLNEQTDSPATPKEGPSRQNTEMQTSIKIEMQIPAMFTPKKKNNVKPVIVRDENLVACPVCNVDIPSKNINLHLDKCLNNSQQQQESSPKKFERRKPLPKLVYSLLQDKDLKKRLKEKGLNTQGDRKTLISRHQRFTLLYNSECDKVNPRSDAEIIQQIEREEKEEKKVNNAGITNMLKIDKKSDPKLIEEAQKQYLHQHKNSFESLIQAIRNRQGGKKPTPRHNVITSDDEDEISVLSHKDSKLEPNEEQEDRKNISERNCIKNQQYEKKPIMRHNVITSDDEDENSNIHHTESKLQPNKEQLDKENISKRNCISDDETPDMSEDETHNSIVERNVNLESEDINQIENMDDTTFDMEYGNNGDQAVSPVLVKNSTFHPSTKDTEDTAHTSLKLTPDMFITPDNTGSDAESNDSISLLTQATQGTFNQGETAQSSSNNPCLSKSEVQTSRKLDSQILDPDFEPDLDDLSQDFEIRRPTTRSKRKAKKMSTPAVPVDTGKGRTLRKRQKC